MAAVSGGYKEWEGEERGCKTIKTRNATAAGESRVAEVEVEGGIKSGRHATTWGSCEPIF